MTQLREIQRHLLSARLRLAIIFLGCIVLALVTPQSSATTLPDFSILTIGDSITLGFKRHCRGEPNVCPRYDVLNPANEGNGVRIGGYQPELEEIYNRYKSDTRAYNWGVGGDTSMGVLNRIDSVLNSRFAHYILIMVGTNEGGVSAETTAFNLGVMVDKARAKGVTPVLATLTYRNYNTGIVTGKNPHIIALANSKNVILADQYAATKPPNWVIADSGDGLHVGFEGDRILAETWFTAITGLPPGLPPEPPPLVIIPIIQPLLLE